MRVIAGSARRLVLKTPEGMDTRPTLDRAKETLFNIIQDQVFGCVFLDAFAGSGGIGIEALSRGAKRAVFADNAVSARDCIRYNLEHTSLSDRAVLISSDVCSAGRVLKSEGPYDIVFMDPPYGSGLERSLISVLISQGAVHEDTLFILEEKNDSDLSWVEGAGLETVRIKEYKTNRHIFMKTVK